MRQEIIKVYSFQELASDVQEKLIEKHVNINTEFDWFDFIVEDWINKLNQIGFIDSKIFFSGFYSQGDGACFTCERVDIPLIINSLIYCNGSYDKQYDIIEKLTYGGLCNCWLENVSSNYCHENTVITHFRIEHGHCFFDSIAKDIEKEINDLRKLLCYSIYQELEQDYEYLTSEEAIKDTLTANEYEFLANGERG